MSPRNDEFETAPGELGRVLNVETETLADRLAILQLISAYSHWIDDFDPNEWGLLFTQDATFEIRFAGDGFAQMPVLEGRQAILDLILPRQSDFRARGVKRRHYLTNPVVMDLSGGSARVMAYLMLANCDPESGLTIEGTGRYDGLVVRAPSGWRIRRWRLIADGGGIAAPSLPDQ